MSTLPAMIVPMDGAAVRICSACQAERYRFNCPTIMKHQQRGALSVLAIMLIASLPISLLSCTNSRLSEQHQANGEFGSARTLLDADWRFHLGDISPKEPVISANYDDQQWRHVDVPHDYVLDGNYVQSEEIPKRSHGYLPTEVAWYRKHISIPQADHGKILRLDFDGVFRDSQVWLNGQFLGRHPSGYTPFSFDITKIAKIGGDNILVVRVDPSQFEGHWYEGGGIYRHVHLTALNPVHVGQWGTSVVSKVAGGEQGADQMANLTIRTTLENAGSAEANCQVISEIIDPNGKLLPAVRATKSIAANGSTDVVQETSIPQPSLWSPDSPRLYKVRTTISQDGQIVDSTETTFGIRTISFDADKGFFLNGKHVEIQGAANHQDMPAVGIAVPDSLQIWRVAKLKAMGCNGWRTAHNQPNEAVLDACDKLGMLVMEENRHLGDAYGSHSPPGTRANDLSDLATMIRRDRNHPSVIMWSLCNEEGLRGRPEGERLFAAMKDVVHRYDQTRPITCAINGSWISKGVTDEDIIGANYHFKEYDAFHLGNPRVPMFGSETTNEKTTRGEYADDRGAGMCSAYNLSEDAELAVANHAYMAGSYTWTGFDYRGEPNPSGWPDISNNTGLMDVCGFPKDKYYYFQSCWSDKPMVHLVPSSWNWPGKEGQNIRVLAFSNCQHVELFLNGHSLGKQDMPHDGHIEWQVPYQPGELLATGYNENKISATDTVQTTGAPARIELTSDRTELQSDGQDSVIASVTLVDDKNRVVPNADQRITFQLTGGGRILGVGNGNPADHDPDRATQRNTFHGRCIVIIQAGRNPSELKLTASSPGAASASLSFKVR